MRCASVRTIQIRDIRKKTLNTRYRVIVCKPDIGMIEQCAKRFNIAPSQSWMIGDTTVDIKTGKNAGTHTALVLTGDAGKDGKYDDTPDMICKNLLDAVKRIVGK